MQTSVDCSLSSISAEQTISAYPTGAIARVEADRLQISNVSQNNSINTIMINLDDAEKLLSWGLDSSYFSSEKRVITTSTINDDLLPKYYLEKEADIVRRFKPNFHVPRDKPVYLTQNKKERIWNIRSQIEEVMLMKNLLSDSSVMLIPLLKGVYYEELLACYLPLKNEGFECFAYYATQYFGKGRGNKSDTLINDIKIIFTLPSIQYLLLIGIQSKRVLGKMPTLVKAHASFDFVRKNCWQQTNANKKQQSTLSKFFRKDLNGTFECIPEHERLEITRIEMLRSG